MTSTPPPPLHTHTHTHTHTHAHTHTHTHTQEVALQAEKAESELRQKILRENAELAKSVNVREERLRHLAQHRQRTKEDRHLFKEEKKVN